MGKYTLELGEIVESGNVKIFDFNYDFYEPNLKGQFEKKFIDQYYFHEIGYETVGRFKHRLKNRLNLIAPKYRQLWETHLASQDINFLLNKDLEETTYRSKDNTDNTDITSNNVATNNTSSNDTLTNNSSTNSTSEGRSNNNNNYKESSLNDGNATLDYSSLTSINNTEDNSTSNDISSSNTNLNESKKGLIESNNNENSTSKAKVIGKEVEEFKLISRGNIGITSSAELLEKWRETILNFDLMIIEECKDLFLKVY